MLSIIEVEGLSKTYGLNRVLSSVSFSVSAGEVVALHGANGAGKSTLLGCLSGILRADSGTISIKGAPPRKTSLQVGVLSSQSLLYDQLSVIENLEFACRLSGANSLGGVLPLVERLGLAEHMSKLPGQCSQGILKRASLARAFVGEPELLLLDEPFANLDTKARTYLLELLDELRARKTTMILATHEKSIAETLCSRQLVLDEGQLFEEHSETREKVFVQ